jgi:hypothetical protein
METTKRGRCEEIYCSEEFEESEESIHNDKRLKHSNDEGTIDNMIITEYICDLSTVAQPIIRRRYIDEYFNKSYKPVLQENDYMDVALPQCRECSRVYEELDSTTSCTCAYCNTIGCSYCIELCCICCDSFCYRCSNINYDDCDERRMCIDCNSLRR